MADFTSHEAAVHQALSLPVVPPSKLFGRDLTLARVYANLKEGKPVLLYGAPGIGKTAIAATLAAAYTELPGGVVWLNVHNASLDELTARAARAYGAHHVANLEQPSSAVDRVAELLAQHRPLIVLDGQPDAAASGAFISRAAPGLPVLLTSDDELEGPWTALRIGRLEPDPALALYKAIANIRDAAQDAEVADLVGTLGHIPFAIVVAASTARADSQPAGAFKAALPQASSASVTPQLLALTAAYRALPNALQGLLLIMGALPTGAASAELISLIAGAPEEAIQNAVTTLIGRQLVERTSRYQAPYYRIHSITHTFAETWLRGSNRLQALQAKVRDGVLQYARKHSTADHDRLAAEVDNLIAIARSAAEEGDRNLAAALAGAIAQNGDFVNARGYVFELLTLRKLSASSTSAFPAYSAADTPPTPSPAAFAPAKVDEDEAQAAEETLEEEAVAADAADELYDEEAFEEEAFEDEQPAGIAFDAELDEEDLEAAEAEPFDEEEEVPEFSDISVLEDVGEAEEAHGGIPAISAASLPPSEPASDLNEIARLRTVLLQTRVSGDRRRQAETLTAIGQAQERAGDDIEASRSYVEALNLYEALNDRAAVLNLLEALAKVTTRINDVSAAVTYATRGAALAQELGNPSSRMRLLALLGDARALLEETSEAAAAYNAALEIVREMGDQRNEAMLKFKLGSVQLDSGDAEQAIRTWDDALKLFREQGRREYEGRVLGGLGSAYSALERWTEAINFHNAALYIAREVGDKEEECLQLTNLGDAFVQAHESGQPTPGQANPLGQAVLRYRQALHLAYESNSRDDIVAITVALATLLVESPRHLAIAELLVDDALQLEPHDRDLKRLKERIEGERATLGTGAPQALVQGSAREYAANAYALLNA